MAKKACIFADSSLPILLGTLTCDLEGVALPVTPGQL